MGIGGHMLGQAKLHRLQRLTGLPLDRAFRRNGQCEGRVVWGGACFHYDINWATGAHRVDPTAMHWASCPPKGTP